MNLQNAEFQFSRNISKTNIKSIKTHILKSPKHGAGIVRVRRNRIQGVNIQAQGYKNQAQGARKHEVGGWRRAEKESGGVKHESSAGKRKSGRGMEILVEGGRRKETKWEVGAM